MSKTRDRQIFFRLMASQLWLQLSKLQRKVLMVYYGLGGSPPISTIQAQHVLEIPSATFYLNIRVAKAALDPKGLYWPKARRAAIKARVRKHYLRKSAGWRCLTLEQKEFALIHWLLNNPKCSMNCNYQETALVLGKNIGTVRASARRILCRLSQRQKFKPKKKQNPTYQQLRIFHASIRRVTKKRVWERLTAIEKTIVIAYIRLGPSLDYAKQLAKITGYKSANVRTHFMSAIRKLAVTNPRSRKTKAA